MHALLMRVLLRTLVTQKDGNFVVDQFFGKLTLLRIIIQVSSVAPIPCERPCPHPH
jgi:hypothetical protein